MKQSCLKLILVTQKNHTNIEHYLKFIIQCVVAGVTSVQLREKNMSDDQLLDFGSRLKKCLKPYSIPLIVNDNVDIAHKLNADGLHLGQGDGDIIQARKKLGNDKLIGLSVNSKTQLREANKLPVDYIGVGPIFATRNKPDASTLWQCRGLRQAVALTSKPIVAIGGINLSNLDAAMYTGVIGVAAIGSFHEADDPAQMTQSLLKIVRKYTHVQEN